MTITIVYLYVFNRSTHQSLHDLISGTFVVKTLPKGKVAAPAIWELHYGLATVLVLAFLVTFVLVTSLSTTSGTLSELRTIEDRVLFLEEVHGVGATVGKEWYGSFDAMREITHLHVKVILKEELHDFEPVARKIAAIVLSQYPDVVKKDHLIVTFVTGFDIGIASKAKSVRFRYSPEKWQEMLKEPESVEQQKSSTSRSIG